MRVSKQRVRNIIREQIIDLLEQKNEPIEYNSSIVIRMVQSDDFLEQSFDDEEGSVSDRLRYIFDEFVRGDEDLERKYRSVREELKQELNKNDDEA